MFRVVLYTVYGIIELYFRSLRTFFLSPSNLYSKRSNCF